MSLGERLREMLDPGTTQGGSPTSPNGPVRRRTRTQAQPVNPTLRSYDATEPARPMPRAQWIGLGLIAALAVALTAGLVFVVMTMTNRGAQTATPTPLPFAASPTVGAQSVATIFASPVVGGPATPAVTPQPTVQRVQIANAGGGSVNLRRDPGPGGERITTLQEGTLVEIVGPDRTVDGVNWRNVRTLQGDVGWVSGEFLAAEGAAPIAGIPGSNATILPVVPSTPGAGQTTSAAPKPTTGVAAAGASRGQVGNTGGQGANIRSEPGSGGRVLKTLADGSNLEVLGPEREVDGTIWRQVRDPASGVTGWIVRGAVAPAGSMPTPVPPRTAPAAGATSAAPKPTAGSGAGANPTAAPKPGSTPAPGSGPAPTATTGAPPGNLPIIIQPATPRPGGSGTGTTPAPTPKPSGGATPKPSSAP